MSYLKRIQTVLILIGVAVLIYPASFCFGASNETINGWLHTDGAKILDSRGQVIVLRGVNSSGMECSGMAR